MPTSNDSPPDRRSLEDRLRVILILIFLSGQSDFRKENDLLSHISVSSLNPGSYR